MLKNSWLHYAFIEQPTPPGIMLKLAKLTARQEGEVVSSERILLKS